eukprot:14190782-Ditylum_brightwellii.AAC.1
MDASSFPLPQETFKGKIILVGAVSCFVLLASKAAKIVALLELSEKLWRVLQEFQGTYMHRVYGSSKSPYTV